MKLDPMFLVPMVAQGVLVGAALLGWLDSGTEQLAAMGPGLPTLHGLVRRRRGRPRKFDEPTRVVSLTLPESLIASLADVHSDLGLAVARLASQQVEVKAPRPSAELVVFGKRAVISVRPTDALERRLGVDLVPLADGRALIALDTPVSLADLELRIADSIEDGALSADERELFETLRDILRDARRSSDVALVRRNIIVLQSGSAGADADRDDSLE